MAAVGLGVLTQVGGSPDADLAILVGASLLVSLGLAPVFGSTTDLIVSSAPPERAGAASGISETGAELGGALGIAILGSIGVAVYRGELAASLPAGIPAEAAAVARDTLGGAVGVASRLPDAVGTALLEAAREAFVRGMQLTVTLSAAVAVGVAVMATVLLRAVPASSEAEPDQPPAPEPEVVAQPEPEPQPAIQVIRVGSGCLACPGERSFSQADGAP
jgi:DHA2 family multidrug resistance protein-like MFS transporter